MMRPMPLVLPDVSVVVRLAVFSAMPDHLQSVNHDQYGRADGGHDQIGPTSFISNPPKERDRGQDHCGDNVAPEFPTGSIDGHGRYQGVDGIDGQIQFDGSKRQDGRVGGVITKNGRENADDRRKDADGCSGIKPAAEDHECAPVTCCRVAKTISGFASILPARSVSRINAMTRPPASRAACRSVLSVARMRRPWMRSLASVLLTVRTGNSFSAASERSV